jgi:two-component system, NtrC family, sensor kinase
MTIRFKLIMAAIAIVVVANSILTFFAAAQLTATWRLLVPILVAAASVVLIYAVAMLVLRPIGRIVAMSRKVISGDMTARVGIRPPGDLGLLCQAIDAMVEAVSRRETQLAQAARQQISRAEKLASIGRLAAGVAHEINNPLTGVLTFAHLLRQKPHMTAEDQQDLDLVIHETTRAAEIVRGLLDFARERPTMMEPLDLNDVVRRTVRLIANQKKFEHIAIEEALRNDLPEVRGDVNPLQQVILNLALNACAAMPRGGKLTIATGCEDGRVLLRVTDTGCGIKEELLEKIFEPFFTTQPVGKGTGLGLSVTYGIVEQHDGTIEVQSKEGQGSTFTISLPALSS